MFFSDGQMLLLSSSSDDVNTTIALYKTDDRLIRIAIFVAMCLGVHYRNNGHISVMRLSHKIKSFAIIP